MATRYVIAALRLGFALLTFAAIGVQLAHTIDAGNSVVNFVSFFTIDSNILAAVLFLALGLTPTGERRIAPTSCAARGRLPGHHRRGLRAPALERRRAGPVAVGQHGAAPRDADRGVPRLADRAALEHDLDARGRVARFPVVWTVYTMIRGAIVDWYPYPFLDPRCTARWRSRRRWWASRCSSSRCRDWSATAPEPSPAPAAATPRKGKARRNTRSARIASRSGLVRQGLTSR